jgi:hypothetical protein
VRFVGQHAQQEPALFLADAERAAAAPHVLARQAVTQPAARAREQFDVGRSEPDLLVEFAKQRLFGMLVAPHAPLWELPAAPVTPTTQEQLAAVAHQDDADVGAEALVVDVVGHWPV